MNRSIKDVAETLQTQTKGQGATLLIGAGCSVDAGIPTAAGFVVKIKEKYPQCYARASPKSYAQCMRELSENHRRELLSQYINSAQINWAHICIAQLMKLGYVDHVLTTNFDPLLLRACALLGVSPAVYDLAASDCPTRITIPTPSIFYLHGQHTGIRLINTEKECLRQSEQLAPIFNDVGRGRAWIVVGYSGENDPLFEHLAQVENFKNNLYWIGHLESQPSQLLQNKLLTDDKYAFYVNGYDANGFFIGLCQEIGCLPDFIAKPFSYLDSVLSTVKPYRVSSQDAEIEIMEKTRKIVQYAIKQYEEVPSGENITLPIQNSAFVLKAQKFLMNEEYDKVVEIYESHQTYIDADLADLISWAYVMQGRNYSRKAMSADENNVKPLFDRAAHEYASALNVNSGRFEAQIDWGNIFSRQMIMFSQRNADELSISASQKYQAALKLNPKSDRAYLCWAEMLCHQYGATEPKSESLFSEAEEKYRLAYSLNAKDSGILGGWANLLVAKAETKDGYEAQKLLDDALEKYEESSALSFNEYQITSTFNNYAMALIARAKGTEYAESETFFSKAEHLLKSANPATHGLICYNLACLYASWGKVELCQSWLEESRKIGALASFLPDFVANDHLLERVRNFDWFQAFVSKGADTDWWTNH